MPLVEEGRAWITPLTFNAGLLVRFLPHAS